MRAMGIAATLALAACGRFGFGDQAVADGAHDATPVVGWSRLDSFADHTCALYEERVYCWGSNTVGQLGDGTMTNRSTPTLIALPAGRVEVLSTGSQSSCAIIDGDVWCWGEEFGGPLQLATGAPASVVTVGHDFLCLTADQTSCMGTNEKGELGDGTTMSRTTLAPIAGPRMRAIHAGEDHACALPAQGGGPLCWGHNDDGFLGTGSLTPDYSTLPVAVSGGLTSLPIAGSWHACALEAGEVWCWGRGGNGELGNGGTEASAVPLRVPALANVTALDVAGMDTSQDASCAIADGDVWCWGMGLDGRLGTGRADPEYVPARVAGLPAAAVEIALGYGHTCATLVDGDVWCWGRGSAGQLGDGSRSGSFVPVRVQRPQ